jgi:hypothetical protein
MGQDKIAWANFSWHYEKNMGACNSEVANPQWIAISVPFA